MSDGSRGSQGFFEGRVAGQPRSAGHGSVSGMIRQRKQARGRQGNEMRAYAVTARTGMQDLLAGAPVVVVQRINDHDRRTRIRAQIVVHARGHADALHQDQQQHDQRGPAHGPKARQSGTGAKFQHARSLVDCGTRTQLR